MCNNLKRLRNLASISFFAVKLTELNDPTYRFLHFSFLKYMKLKITFNITTVILLFSFFLFSCSKTEEPLQVEIIKIQPEKSRVNQTIAVIGKGFNMLLAADSSTDFRLYIGGIQCDAAVINDTLLEVFIPSTAISGETCLEWKGNRTCGPVPFTLLPGNGIQNTFQKLPAYPGKKNRPGSMFSINGDVYIGMDDFWRFNVETQVWRPIANMPEWAVRTSTFVINKKAYVFGGLSASNGNGSNGLWEYDPTINQWKKKSAMPAAGRFNSQVFVHNNKAYVLGGYEVHNNPVNTECWVYDPLTDQWTRENDLPAPVENEGNTYQIGDLYYVPAVNGTIEFDPVRNTRKLLLTGPRTRFSAIHSSNRWMMAYIIQYNQVLRVVRRFDGEIIADTYKIPIAPGDKTFSLYCSAGEELFFLHINELTYENEFWEYLPE